MAGIVAVQFIFANHIDKDEYQRIMGGLIALGIQEFIRRKA